MNLLTRGLISAGIILNGGLCALAQVEVATEEANRDIQSLQAWNTPELFTPAQVDLDRCQLKEVTQDSLSNYKVYDADCTFMLQSLIGAPLAHKVVIRYYKEQGSERMSSDWRCYLTEIRSMIKDSALASDTFDRVGFYHSAGAIHFVDKPSLKRVGLVRLKDSGEAASVFRFVSLSRCWAGSMSSSMNQTERFKPFVDFKSGDGLYHRRWEDVPSNFMLGRSYNEGRWHMVEGFNRELELLRP